VLKITAQLLCLFAAAWCVMTFTHELGHILGGWSCGATLQQVDLVPWHLPFSLFEPDPYPLITLWSGPLFGAFAPLLLAYLLNIREVWLIAYFCLFANGLYIAAAWFSGERYLDTTQLLEHGANSASIVCFCVVTIVCGYIGLRQQLILMCKQK
jgi:hypothetical protein